MAYDCLPILPVSAFISTNINSRIDTYGRLGDRILRSLGAPLIKVEIHQDQLFENISIACEMFTKFAGYTEEYLVFDSNIYQPRKGIKLDDLFSISTDFNYKVNATNITYIATSNIDSSYFSSSPTLSSYFSSGIYTNQLLTNTDYLSVITFDPTLSAGFQISNANQNRSVNSFDYDLLDYRKVMSVVDFEEGSSSNINTLFTIEQSMAQQTYFSYAMGNYGFDLISWYVLKDWMKIRDKMLATRRTYTFNPRSQYLQMTPSPGIGSSPARFFGILKCYVEKPIRDIIKEQWPINYAISLCKISVGRVRGKYTGTTLFGGGTLNTDLLAEGLAEKEKLEQMLFTGASPGYGDVDPVGFLIG